MSRGWAVGAILLLALAGSGCSGDSSTGPGTGSGSGLFVSVVVLVNNAAAQSTVTRMQLLWDGAVIDDQSFSPATNDVGLGGTVTTGSGNHTIGVKVISQIGSAVTYTMSPYVQATNSANNATQEIDPPTVSRSLSTGSASNISVTLN